MAKSLKKDKKPAPPSAQSVDEDLLASLAEYGIATPTDNQDKILEFVKTFCKENHKAADRKAITKGTGCPDASIGSVLVKFVEQGKLLRIARGLYIPNVRAKKKGD